MLANGLECSLKFFAERKQRRYRRLALGQGLLDPFEFSQRLIPALLQRSSHQTIVRVHTQELSLGQHSFIAQAFQVLLMRMGDLLGSVLLGSDGTAVDIELNRREHLKKRSHNVWINRIPWNMLTHRHP